MKNYFDSENIIIPFDKVIVVAKSQNEVIAMIHKTDNVEEYHKWYYFPLCQLDDYKKWLDLQYKKDLAIANQIKISDETDTNRVCYNCTEQGKGAESENCIMCDKGFSHFIPRKNVEQSNRAEKQNNQDHIEDKLGMVLNKEQVKKINAITMPFNCDSCTRKLEGCSHCAIDFDPTDEFVAKVNKILEEK